MNMKSVILLPAALLAALPFAASAETPDAAELAALGTATVSVQQAGEIAMKDHPGKLATVSFGSENGRVAYEAIVIGADGQPWTVLIDPQSGEVFASGASSTMEDQNVEHRDAGDDGKNDEGGNGDNGGEDDDA